MKKILLLCFLPLSVMASSLTMVMTVDWEGDSISLENIDAIKKFRNAHPEIPILHFLNPAYYTKKGADASIINSQINSILTPKDELGLHIHAWKSLVEYCGLTYQGSPVFGRCPEYSSTGD